MSDKRSAKDQVRHRIQQTQKKIRRVRSKIPFVAAPEDVIFHPKTSPPGPLPPISHLRDKPVQPSGEKHPKYPFENLAFQGGGVKGLAYAGALAVLEERGIYPDHIKRVAGSSIGSIFAAFTALGLTVKQMHTIMDTDLGKIVLDGTHGKLLSIASLHSQFGENPGELLYEYVGDQLRKFTGSADITFEQILLRYGRELCIPVTNVSRLVTEYCHPKTTPTMPVNIAIRMSAALPVVLSPLLLHPDSYEDQTMSEFADIYADGSILCNYPIHAFDGWFLSLEPQDSFLARFQPFSKAQEMASTRSYFDPPNPRSLGFAVVAADQVSTMHDWQTPKHQLPERPDTPLAIAANARTREKAQQTKFLLALDHFSAALTTLLGETGATVDRPTFTKLVGTDDFTAQDAKTLFSDTDLNGVFDTMDRNHDGEIDMYEFVIFFESINFDPRSALTGIERRDCKTFQEFLAALFTAILNEMNRAAMKESDRERTVVIDTDYVHVDSFDLVQADKEFLIQSGANATNEFLDAYDSARDSDA